MDGVRRFRPIGWFVDAKRQPARLFAVDGDESDLDKKFRIQGFTGSYLENRLWEDYAGLPSISTALGLQFATAQGIPILTIDQSNATALLPTLNVFPEVRQAVQDAVGQGHVVTIPQDTLFFHDWVGSVWIDEIPGSSAAYLILGGLLGSSTSVDPEEKKGENPFCSTVSSDLATDGLRAVAWQESTWRQFSNDKRPFNEDKGDVGIMQVNRKTWQNADIPGTQVKINWEDVRWDPAYNIQVGAAIYNLYKQRAVAHLGSLVGQGNYTPEQLVTEAYFLYNQGGHAHLKDGTLVDVFYYTLDPTTGTLQKGPHLELLEADRQVVDHKQGNADAVQQFFLGKPWNNPTALMTAGCQ